MANISYWLTVKVKTGQAPQITHDTTVTLKVFFDENHNDDKNKLNSMLYAEYSSVTPIGKSSGQQRFDFQITEREYNASTFTLYIWAEPYGYVAFRNNLDEDHLAAGRLRFEAKYCKKNGLIDPPPNSQKDDLQIICECDAVQSVVNYMADEMNSNLNSPYLNKIKSKFLVVKQHYYIGERVPTEEITSNLITGGVSRRKIDIAPEAWRSYQQAKGNIVYSQAINDYACLVHSMYFERKTDSWIQKNITGPAKNGAQDIYFCGMITDEGGKWDHKPNIYKFWGTNNRLGNADHSFFYDIWSNMHYGFIGKKLGFDDYTLLEGGARAQGIDNANAKGDDIIDTEAIKEGFMLSNKINKISIDDLINIVEKHYNWRFSERAKQWEKK